MVCPHDWPTQFVIVLNAKEMYYVQGVLLEIHFLDNDVQPIVFVMPGNTTVLCCILQKLEHQPFWRTARLKTISMQLRYALNELPKC